MKILVLGAGGTGGYYGGRLAEAGVDTTFLVRESRQAQLKAHGLILRSPFGDAVLEPKTVTASQINDTYDVILLSCKAYGLEEAISNIRAAVNSDTLIIPILNGLPHYELLERHFKPEQILGGLCHIIATLSPKQEVLHMNNFASLTFGIRKGIAMDPKRCEAVLATFQKSNLFTTIYSDCIEQAAWEKLTLLATLAAASCLMRGAINEIMATDFGPTFLASLLSEIESIAAAEGYPVSETAHAMSLAVNVNAASNATASMQRDLLQNSAVEADPILGDLIQRALRHKLAVPFLQTAYTHLQVYQNRGSA